jgi:hypothetical protein
MQKIRRKLSRHVRFDGFDRSSLVFSLVDGSDSSFTNGWEILPQLLSFMED